MKKIMSLFVALFAVAALTLASCGDDATDCAEADKGTCNTALTDCTLQCGMTGNAGDCIDGCTDTYCGCLANIGCDDDQQCK